MKSFFFFFAKMPFIDNFLFKIQRLFWKLAIRIVISKSFRYNKEYNNFRKMWIKNWLESNVTKFSKSFSSLTSLYKKMVEIPLNDMNS